MEIQGIKIDQTVNGIEAFLARYTQTLSLYPLDQQAEILTAFGFDAMLVRQWKTSRKFKGAI